MCSAIELKWKQVTIIKKGIQFFEKKKEKKYAARFSSIVLRIIITSVPFRNVCVYGCVFEHSTSDWNTNIQ